MGYEYGNDDDTGNSKQGDNVDDYGYGDSVGVVEDDYGYGSGAPDDYGYGDDDDKTNTTAVEDYGYGDDDVTIPPVVSTTSTDEYGYQQQNLTCLTPPSVSTSHRIKRRCSVTKYNLDDSTSLTAADRIKELRGENANVVSGTTASNFDDDALTSSTAPSSPKSPRDNDDSSEIKLSNDDKQINSIISPGAATSTSDTPADQSFMSKVSTISPNTTTTTSHASITTASIVSPPTSAVKAAPVLTTTSTSTKKDDTTAPKIKKKGVLSRMRKRLSLAF